MPISCPTCNTQNRDTARFCTNCSEPLVQKIFCPFCGTECSSRALFCMNCATPLRGSTAAKTGLLPPDTLLQNRYTIVGRVGHGGMGAVYEALDTRITGKRWAVKELSDAALGTPKEKQDAMNAFRQEAQMLALLDHPNLPVVSDFFSEGGKHYLVMEFIDGETLEDRLNASTVFFDQIQVLGWIDQICRVLGYLHTQNPPVIFRDLKPGNVMIDSRGVVKLIDFGIARLFKIGKSTDTQAMGTPGYAAPEQYGKGQTDSRSDVYSLGVLLHQLLTRYDPGHTPFNLPASDNINPDISEPVVQVIQKATQTQPLARFQSVVEMQQALKSQQQPAHPVPVPIQRTVKSSMISPSTGLRSVLRGLTQPAALSSPGIPSYWKAIGAHLIIGCGLFYVDKRLKRKWLYPVVFIFALVSIYDSANWYFLSDFFGYRNITLAGWTFFNIYVLSFIDVVSTCQTVVRGGSATPSKISYLKALGLHLMLGAGITYIDNSLRRRWLYPIAFVYRGLAFFEFGYYGVIGDIFGFNFLFATLYLAISVFIFGFIDVILTVQAVLRGSNPVPVNLRWWKAIGLHLSFGFGLAYVDSSLRRKWMYPIIFIAALGLLIATEAEVLYWLDDPLGILFLIFSSIYIFGFIDVLLSYRSRLKTNT